MKKKKKKKKGMKAELFTSTLTHFCEETKEDKEVVEL